MPTKDMPSCHSEIVALHRFFQDWYNGTIPDNLDSLQRVITVWPEDFSIIFPNGYMATRSEVLDQLQRDYNSDPLFRIEIKNLRLRWSNGEMALMFYEEWHSDQQEIEAGTFTS